MSVLVGVGSNQRCIVHSDDLFKDENGQLCILLEKRLVHCQELLRGGYETLQRVKCQLEGSVKVQINNLSLDQGNLPKNESEGKNPNLVYTPEEIIKYRRIFGNEHKCKKCKFFTRSVFVILNHSRFHKLKREAFNCAESTSEKFVCGRCQFSTPFLVTFRKHIKSSCQIGSVKKTRKKVRRKAEKMKWKRCKNCDYKSERNSHLKRHIINKHTSSDAINWYQCDNCEYKAKEKSQLRKHIVKWHSPPEVITWYKCKDCNYKCTMNSDLKRHVTSKHTSWDVINWFECNDCGYKAKEKGNLKRHITNKHTSSDAIDWHKCDDCEYKAKEKSYLKRHIINLHTPLEAMNFYQCQHCNYKFKDKSHLKRHVTNKHSDSANCNY